MLSAGVFANSAGADQSQGRAVALLSQQVRAQAFTESIADGFVLMCWVVVGFLIAMLFMRPGILSYKDLRKMP
jgi:MFS transporter, DHA2 family, multidrug resistance protein